MRKVRAEGENRLKRLVNNVKRSTVWKLMFTVIVIFIGMTLLSNFITNIYVNDLIQDTDGNLVGAEKVGAAGKDADALLLVVTAVATGAGALDGGVFPGEERRIIIADCTGAQAELGRCFGLVIDVGNIEQGASRNIAPVWGFAAKGTALDDDNFLASACQDSCGQ